MNTCPACNGTGLSMGVLGQLEWFRCQQCGIEFNAKAKSESLTCPHCGNQLLETGYVVEHYDGTCDVEYSCDCGHTEVRLEESEEPPFEEPDYPNTIHFEGDDELYPGEFRH